MLVELLIGWLQPSAVVWLLSNYFGQLFKGQTTIVNKINVEFSEYKLKILKKESKNFYSEKQLQEKGWSARGFAKLFHLRMRTVFKYSSTWNEIFRYKLKL